MNVERTRDAKPSNPLAALLPALILGTDVLIALVMWVFRLEILGEERQSLMVYICAALILGGVASFFVLKNTLSKINQ